MKINEAVILLGGMGTRLLPYTKTISKEMLPIYDVPCIFKLVQEAYLSGIRKIIFVVTKHNKYLIEKLFKENNTINDFLSNKPDKQEMLKEINEIISNVEFKYVYQTIKGTYGALYSARKLIHNDNFIVMYGDDLFDDKILVTKELITHFQNDHKMYVTVMKKDYEELPNVGVAKIENNYLVNLVSKDEITNGFELYGRMLLNKKIFTIKNELIKHKDDEYYLSYALLKFKGEVKVYQYTGNYFNIGDKLGFIKASIYFASKDKNNKKNLKDFLKKID